MNGKIRKLNLTILFLIIVLIPINQIGTNYLFKYRVFSPFAESTYFLIQPTLVANLISLAIFSFLIFLVGKHNLSSVWFSKEKIKIALLPVFLIWLLSQIISLVWSYLIDGTIQFSDNFNIKTGNLIGQLFGNAAFEELIYRGILFLQFYVLIKTKTTENKALLYSVILSQIIFTLIHIPNRLLINQVDNLALDLFGLFIAGSILTVIFIRTKNLMFLIGVHTLINQPYNLIETTFPLKEVIYLMIIVITIFWNNIAPGYQTSNSYN